MPHRLGTLTSSPCHSGFPTALDVSRKRFDMHTKKIRYYSRPRRTKVSMDREHIRPSTTRSSACTSPMAMERAPSITSDPRKETISRHSDLQWNQLGPEVLASLALNDALEPPLRRQSRQELLHS